MSVEIHNDHHAALVQLAGSAPPSASQLTRLRKQFDQPTCQSLLAVAALQAKARSKLGDGVWWVTQRALMQATPWQVAKLKASWFGDVTVHDLCCGIGGDCLQLNRRVSQSGVPVVGVDQDPMLVEMARRNLRSEFGTSCSAEIECADVTRLANPASSALHIDPDRRPGGRRTSTPDFYQPSWQQILRLIQESDAAIVKLAPAANPEVATITSTHRCWISLSGSVREQSLLWGDVVERSGVAAGGRSAFVVRHDAGFSHFAATPELDSPAGFGDQPEEFLLDPDAAIRAAGLTETFANRFGLRVLGGPSGFLTGDNQSWCDAPEQSAIVGRVIWHGSADDRKLRRELRQRNAYPAAIKTRGTDHDPAKMTKRFRQCGDQPVTLWLGRTGGRVYAAITEPVSSVRDTTSADPGE